MTALAMIETSLTPLPAPAPCRSWCTAEAHREGRWEHVTPYPNPQLGVSADSTCSQVIGTVDWPVLGQQADSDRPDATVTVERYQAFEQSEDTEVRLFPASIELVIQTDENMTPAAARRLAQLLVIAADRAGTP